MDARRVLQDAPYAIHYCTMPRYSKRGLNGSATKSRKSFMKRDGPLAARSHTRFILRRYSPLSLSLFHKFSFSLSHVSFSFAFFPCLANPGELLSFRPVFFPPLLILFEIVDTSPRNREDFSRAEIHASSSSLHRAVFIPLRMILRSV